MPCSIMLKNERKGWNHASILVRFLASFWGLHRMIPNENNIISHIKLHDLSEENN